jgi:hypothetical protein
LLVFTKLGYRKIAQKGEGIAFPFFCAQIISNGANAAPNLDFWRWQPLPLAGDAVNLILQLLAIA